MTDDLRVPKDRLRFFIGLRNAMLFVLPLWVVIYIWWTSA